MISGVIGDSFWVQHKILIEIYSGGGEIEPPLRDKGQTNEAFPFLLANCKGDGTA